MFVPPCCMLDMRLLLLQIMNAFVIKGFSSHPSLHFMVNSLKTEIILLCVEKRQEFYLFWSNLETTVMWNLMFYLVLWLTHTHCHDRVNLNISNTDWATAILLCLRSVCCGSHLELCIDSKHLRLVFNDYVLGVFWNSLAYRQCWFYQLMSKRLHNT